VRVSTEETFDHLSGEMTSGNATAMIVTNPENTYVEEEGVSKKHVTRT
jgi:hypothetical protein